MKKNQTNHKRIVYSLSLVALLLISGVSVASEPMMDDLPAFVIVTSETLDLESVMGMVQESQGKIFHVFSPHSFIGQVSTGLEESLLQDPGISIFRGPVDQTEYEGWEKSLKYAAISWNNNYMGFSVDMGLNEPPLSPEPPPDDTELIPDLESLLASSEYQVSYPYGAGFLDTSEYLVGSVAVGVLFLESNGTIDEDLETWTEEEEAKATSEIQNGLNWLLLQDTDIDLQFVYEFHYNVPVGYEPISRPHSDDDLWEQQAMFHLGYTNPDYLINEYTYANDLRKRYGTDWAFIILMVDSSEDEDNSFADGHYAYAFLGGPRMVATYSNSIWGIANLDSIIAHETCHIFWALDQHCNDQVPASATSGYLGTENLNSEWNGESCTVTVPSIMKGEFLFNTQVDVTAQNHLGWQDTDSDGICDVLDTAPEVSSTVDGDQVTGTATVSPLSNENPFKDGNDITFNTITSVQYRIGEDPWTDVEAIDGMFDEAVEEFSFPISLETCGQHTIQIRAQNSVGNWSDPVDVTITIEGKPLLQAEVEVSPEGVNQGDTVTVTMNVHNTGDTAAIGVVPHLNAPEAVTYLSGPDPESADIAPDEMVSFVWTYEVNSAEGFFTFSGNATGQTESGEAVSSESSDSNAVDVHVNIQPGTGISALLYGIIEDNTITLTLEVQNTGEVMLENVSPSDITVTCTGTATATLVVGPLPQPPITVNPGEMKTFEWKYTALAGAQGGVAVFTANVVGDTPEQGAIVSDIVTATVGIESPAILTSFVIATPKQLEVGDTITVAMTIQNIGKANALNVVPQPLTVSGTGEVELLTGPSRASVNVEGRTFEIIHWEYKAVKAGTVTFSGTAQGIDSRTGEGLTVPMEQSNKVTILESQGTDTGTDTGEGNGGEDQSGDAGEGTDTGEGGTDTGDSETDDEGQDQSDDQGTPDTQQPVNSRVKLVQDTIINVKKLLENAKKQLADKEKERRDTRICRNVLSDAEFFLQQAEISFANGDYDQAHKRALTAMKKIFDLINCLKSI
ncbi:MAG: hypothetical protein HXS53_05345 [Theionarchaea archaeon]|nr:hypothetical protein [Theionarchaea archaeon]